MHANTHFCPRSQKIDWFKKPPKQIPSPLEGSDHSRITPFQFQLFLEHRAPIKRSLLPLPTVLKPKNRFQDHWLPLSPREFSLPELHLNGICPQLKLMEWSLDLLLNIITKMNWIVRLIKDPNFLQMIDKVLSYLHREFDYVLMYHCTCIYVLLIPS